MVVTACGQKPQWCGTMDVGVCPAALTMLVMADAIEM